MLANANIIDPWMQTIGLLSMPAGGSKGCRSGLNERIGARPWLAHTKAEYALLLRRRGRRGDSERAEALANEAWKIAAELDMVLLKRRLQPKIH